MDQLTRRQFFGLTAGALVAVPALSAFDTLPVVKVLTAPSNAKVAYLTEMCLRSSGGGWAQVWLATSTQRHLMLAKHLKPYEVYIPDMPLVLWPDTRLVIEGSANCEFEMHWVEHQRSLRIE